VRLLPEAELSDLVGELDRMAGAWRSDDPWQGRLFTTSGIGGGVLTDIEVRLLACESLTLRVSDALTGRYFSHVHEDVRATAVI
jgi:hypothetical protein